MNTQAGPDAGEPGEAVLDIIACEAPGARASARLLEYCHGSCIALPVHTTLELLENPVYLAVPGAAYYAYGLMSWQGRQIPLIDFDALQRAHQSPHRSAAPRYALVVAYQSVPYQPLEYGAISLSGLPQTVDVQDSDWCELPTDSDIWPWLSISCFRHAGSAVPVVDTARLFAAHHG